MKRILFLLMGGLLGASLAGAATTALQAVDGGGARAASADYVADQSLGGVGGISTAAAPESVARHGYVGQLVDPAALAVVPESAEVDEGASQQLDGVLTYDDDTAQPVAGDEVAWSEPAFPVAAVAADGVATAANVYEDTPAVVTGRCQDVEGAGGFLVRNVGTDDFDTYAADGLPDDWQVDHFGVGSPDAGPTNNVDEDLHDNQGEWIADTDPTDGDSFFRIEAVSNREATAEVWVDSSASRRYSLERTTNLAFPDWQPVAGQTDLPGLDGLRSLVETNPAEPHHYRVGVQVP